MSLSWSHAPCSLLSSDDHGLFVLAFPRTLLTLSRCFPPRRPPDINPRLDLRTAVVLLERASKPSPCPPTNHKSDQQLPQPSILEPSSIPSHRSTLLSTLMVFLASPARRTRDSDWLCHTLDLSTSTYLLPPNLIPTDPQSPSTYHASNHLNPDLPFPEDCLPRTSTGDAIYLLPLQMHCSVSLGAIDIPHLILHRESSLRSTVGPPFASDFAALHMSSTARQYRRRLRPCPLSDLIPVNSKCSSKTGNKTLAASPSPPFAPSILPTAGVYHG